MEENTETVVEEEEKERAMLIIKTLKENEELANFVNEIEEGNNF